jgi:hypothetical protein
MASGSDKQSQLREGIIGRWRKNGGRLAIRLTTLGILLASCCCFPSWLVLFATWPAQQVAEVKITAADGTIHTITLWRAKPLVPMLFEDAESSVEFQNHRDKIHGRSFENSPGDVFVSPDGLRLMVASRHRGLECAVVIYDIGTGKREYVDDLARDYESRGWQRQQWKKPGTSLPFSIRDE